MLQKYLTYISVFLLAGVGLSVIAEETKPTSEKDKMILMVKENDCAKINKDLTSKKIVSADYQAGVDVYGKKVVPADSSDNTSILSGERVLSLSLDPIAFKEIKAKGVEIKDMEVGKITIKDGKVMLGDKTVDSEIEKMVIDACSELKK